MNRFHDSLLQNLDHALVHRGFRRKGTSAEAVLGCWVRRGWMTNRAVVVLACPADEDPAVFARDSRGKCAKAVGFFVPLFYGIGLQVVTVGPAQQTPAAQLVDRIDNQWCVLQALHLVDEQDKTVASAATWGQVVSGSDQEAVSQALQLALRRVKGEGDGAPPEHAPAPVHRPESPRWIRNGIIVAALLVLVGQLVRLAAAW